MRSFPSKAFTASYQGRSNVLITDVIVGQAFDHQKMSDPPGVKRKYRAVWDTGATNSVITERVAQECGLKPISLANIETANGTRQCNVYLASILLPNTVGISSLTVTEATLNGDIEVLIGMDVIGSGDFAVTCSNGNTIFSFRYPSTDTIDFVKESNRKRARQKQRLQRNNRKHGK